MINLKNPAICKKMSFEDLCVFFIQYENLKERKKKLCPL